MNRSRLSFVLVASAVLWPHTTFGQAAGDRVVVAVEKAMLKALDEITGSVPKWTILTANEVRGNWIWVIHSSGNATIKGWIRRLDVVSLEKALELLNDQLRRAPTAELHVMRATIWDEKAEYEKEIADYTAALRLDPDYTAIYQNRGYAWARLGVDEKAIADYSEFIRGEPADATAYYDRGNAHWRIGEYRKAIADFSESIRLDPNDGSSYCNRGQVLAVVGELEGAFADFNECGRLLGLSVLSAIKFEGNRQNSTEELLKVLTCRSGQKLDRMMVEADIQTLILTRRFYEVKFRVDQTPHGLVLVFCVADRPLLQRVTYSGNYVYDNITLAELTFLRPGISYDVGANRELRRRIEDFYHERGYSSATVVLDKGESRADREVAFKIYEGPGPSGFTFPWSNSRALWLVRSLVRTALAKTAQEGWAKSLGKLSPLEGNSVGMVLALIPPGQMTMGSPDFGTFGFDGKVQVNVAITKPFYLGTTEVTQGQWQAVMGTRPWTGIKDVREGDSYPATYVSWDDAQTFCRKLSEKENAVYRLPTEAEWEYSCRAGSLTAFTFGDDLSKLGECAWFWMNGEDAGEPYAHLVGQKRSNSWGLCDMYGNVNEWCQDAYVNMLPGGTDPDVTSRSQRVMRVRDERGNLWTWCEDRDADDLPGDTDPEAGADSLRVIRGGCWDSGAHQCDSAHRSWLESWGRGRRVGFRVARSCGR